MVLRSDAQVNHLRIVSAATDAFAEKGLAADMKEIADRAGVAVGTLYRHFPGKEEMLTAILRQAIAGKIAGIEVAEAIADPLAALRFLLAHEYSRVERYGWLTEATVSGQIPASCTASLRADVQKLDYAGRFERLIERGIEAGQLRADLDVKAAAAMLGGTALPWNYRRFAQNHGAERAAALVFATFLRGAAAE
ncbi:MAG TPA: helix-turn-helix domain-containing protein [Dehalococcoidia bacterium]|nr:helix-turn-helix domain-containing protein [Dehalococcoidia bacterium]